MAPRRPANAAGASIDTPSGSSPVRGAEFLLRRLQRATEAAAEHPEAAAFVESVQLLREVCDLLPLTPRGEAALPDTPAAQRQVLTAYLKAARAIYLCPEPPVCDRLANDHILAYVQRPGSALADSGSGGGGATRALGHLAGILELLLTASHMLAHGVFESAVFLGREALIRMNDREAGRQLAELAAATQLLHCQQLPLSFNQLQWAACATVLRAASVLQDQSCAHQTAQASGRQLPRGAGAAPQLPPAQLADLQQLQKECAVILMGIEPDNAMGCLLAGSAAGHRGQHQQAGDLYLRAFQLGQQQNREFAALLGATYAIGQTARAHAVSRAMVEAAVAAFQHVKPMLLSCKRFLPQPWLEEQEAALSLNTAQCAAAQRMLQQRGASVAALERRVQALDFSRLHSCDSCSKEAVGLRNCARCKKAHYCSKECQAKHWRTHKKDCVQV